MPSTNLRFQQTQPASLNLRFGAAGTSNEVVLAVGIRATLPDALSPTLSLQERLLASLNADVTDGLAPAISALYDNSVNRAPHAWDSANWETAAARRCDTDARHDVAPKREHNAAVAIVPGERRQGDFATPWEPMSSAIRPAKAVAWIEAKSLAHESSAAFADLLRHHRPARSAPWGKGRPLATEAADRWIDLFRTQRSAKALQWSEGRRAALSLTPAFGAGRAIRRDTRVPWQEARPPAHGTSITIIVNPPVNPPCYNPQPGQSVVLVFRDLQPASLDLRFRCPNPASPDPEATIVVPVRRIYMQSNTVTLVLADTGQPIPARGLNLSLDADSWCWGWSASVPASYLSLLQAAEGDLVELLASVNGTAFRFAVERLQRTRSFGKAELAISGRGRAAWLADPYADSVSRSNAETMTAQQLMADALTENGVSIGWDLDWQITDWTVPAGAWHHTGTALEACLAIAEAGGAYIQAHRTEQTLAVLPRYPAAPWNWSGLTPDIELPEDVCTTEGIEWIDKPKYNTVFVSGQNNGVLCHVTRGGTAGDRPAPMVTDALTTHSDAGRQRGLRILSDVGRQKHITLSLPVLSATGIIVPGKLIRYTENGAPHLGLTRAVQVSADFPKVRQSITVESHVL